MVSTEQSLISGACITISSSVQLREAQELVAQLSRGSTAAQELPVTAAAGRILAQDVALQNQPSTVSWLRAGCKLDWRSVPMLRA